jgi:tetratricopeptide (TPR) repeat protein
VLRKHGEKISSEKPVAGAPGAGGAPSASSPRPAKGIEDYREILKLNPNDFEAQFKIAGLLMQEHHWAEAIKELEDLRRKFPRNIEVMNLLGWSLLNYGKVDDAFMAWRKARVIDPKNYQITESLIKAHMTMGRTLRDKGLYTPCLVHFKALERYLPENDEVHYEIGKTYQLKGDERSAFQEFNKVLQLNPKHKEARNGLSSLKLRR